MSGLYGCVFNICQHCSFLDFEVFPVEKSFWTETILAKVFTAELKL